jgi:hypothetical protein
MPAAVIDLEAYRRRRTQNVTTGSPLAPMPLGFVQWVPVVYWVPVWPM